MVAIGRGGAVDNGTEDIASRERRVRKERKRARQAGDADAEERALQELLDIERISEKADS